MDTRLEKTTSVLQQKMSDMKFELLKWLIGLARSAGWLNNWLAEVFPDQFFIQESQITWFWVSPVEN
jgi:hypothetical protein